jgi:hypothetical protein
MPVASSTERKAQRYERGLKRLDDSFSSLRPEVCQELNSVHELYRQHHAATALLRAALAFERTIVENVRSAVQEHFNLTKRASIQCLLQLPRNERGLDRYLQRTGQPNVDKLLERIDADVHKALKFSKEMRNRYIHGTTIFNAEQFAEGILGYEQLHANGNGRLNQGGKGARVISPYLTVEFHNLFRRAFDLPRCCAEV